MPEKERIKQDILTAAGVITPELVLKNARIVNVFSEDIEEADIAIARRHIVGIGHYEGEKEIDLGGSYVCPGFIDGHIHLESSMVSPYEFEKAVLPHGTTAVVTDPHEIANVSGTEGIQYMMDATAQLDMDVFFMLPSCVPATDLDEAGAVLLARQLRPLYSEKKVLGLAELMNAFGTIQADEKIIDKIYDALSKGKLIDGHAPGLTGNALNAYVIAGVGTDHECSNMEEALEKLRRGQWIMVRDGTAAKNLEALIELCNDPYYHRCMFVTDDKHPGDLIGDGHIDGIIRKAVSLGADPIKAIKMGSLHTAQCFGIKDKGAIAPGYSADLVVFSDLKELKIEKVFKNGKLLAENGKSLIGEERKPKYSFEDESHYLNVYHSFRMDDITEEDFALEPKGSNMRIIQLVDHELLTLEKQATWTQTDGLAGGVNLAEDIVKLAVLERHKGSGHVGLGFLSGYGLKSGAIATSVAHDSHNLIVAGVTDADMALAANTVRESEGGLAVVKDGKVLGQLPLPIGGLMSLKSVEEVDEQLEALKRHAHDLGVSSDIDAFMTLAFVSLPVIPKLRLNTLGLVDVEKQEIVSVTW